MAEMALPLSVGAVRGLRDRLKNLARALRDDVVVDMEQAVCAMVADDVRDGIGSIQDVDGNYLSDGVFVEVGLRGHDVIWRGKQIQFLEWGTGAAGASGGGDTVAMSKAGYHPDPTKTSWWYMDNGVARLSHGLSPQAPMYNAATAMRLGASLSPARVVLKEALNAVAV